jgi:Tfp pilus assembly protein PilX
LRTLRNNILASQQGYLILLVAIMIVVIGFIGVAVSSMFYASTFSTSGQYQGSQAFYIAEAGLEAQTHNLLQTTVLQRGSCVGPLTASFGAGSFTATGTTNYAGDAAAATTLNGALTATATTVPVVSTSGYTSVGRIMIDNEFMNYGAVTATSFTNVTRGVDGSTAAAHVTGSHVSQFECEISSTGTVTPFGSRTVQANATIQEAWAVGDVATGGNYTLTRFNHPDITAWFNYNIGGGVALTSVFMVSYAEGWIVGAGGLAARWNGNTTVTQTLNPAITYRSVWCLTGNQCYTVGDVSGGATVIESWNGTTWSKATISGLLPDTNLKSVMCDSTTDCWAVGDKADAIFPYFYQWNGTQWTAVTQSALTGYTFNGVFCNSTTDCWAVGATAAFARKSSTSTTWANFATGLPAAQYNGIFCNATNDCWTVGNSNGGQDLFAHWNGTAWSRNTSNPTPVANLNGVTCVNTNDCWAVGSAVTGNLPVYVHWDGTSWTQFTTLGNGPFPAAALRSVTIVGPSTQPLSGWSENFD